MPTIGFTTTTFTDQPTALPGLEFAIRHGFHALELSGNHLWPEVATEAELATLREDSERHGVSLSVHFPPSSRLGSPEESERLTRVDELRATISLVSKIRGVVVVVHTGTAGNAGGTTDEVTPTDRVASREQVIDSLRRIATDAERAGISVCLENMPFDPELPVQSYQEQVDIVRRIGSPAVALTLDVGHAFRSGGVAQAFRAFGPWLRHMHIHDATQNDAHLEIGQGSIDFEPHADALRRYANTMVMEINVEGEGQTAPARGLTAPALLRSRELLRSTLGNAV